MRPTAASSKTFPLARSVSLIASGLVMKCRGPQRFCLPASRDLCCLVGVLFMAASRSRMHRLGAWLVADII